MKLLIKQKKICHMNTKDIFLNPNAFMHFFLNQHSFTPISESGQEVQQTAPDSEAHCLKGLTF